ncbi:MAG: hypothetical protein RLZ35_948 [Pseudomonadota bacterium]|jgi:UPF0755 protein
MLKKFKTVFFLGAFIGIAWVAIQVIQGYQTLFLPIQIAQAEQFFEISPGSSLSGILKKLEKENIPINSNIFMLLIRWQGVESKLQAGEYRIVQGVTTPMALLEDMVMGRVVQRPFLLVEGWTVYQLLTALQKDTSLEHTPELRVDNMMHLLSQQIAGDVPKHPEGLFFPDTYYFSKPTKDIDLLNRIRLTMDKKLLQAWVNRSPRCTLASPYEALILASIVEKETAKSDEYEKIAGVYFNRLRKNMLLQADPTVVYGLGDGMDRPLTKEDLKTPTPYNTYLHLGLPPTPICIPGERAIKAVMHPAETDALYFVASGQGDKGHYFSKTLSEHNQAVSRYRKTMVK